jgi:histidinol phosphatase-like enzyme
MSARPLAFCLLALLPIFAAGCAGDSVEEKDEADQVVSVKEGLKRRTLFLRPRGFTQFKDLRRASYQIPVAFLDADSTLRLSSSGKATPSGAADVFILPCVGARLAQLANDGYFIALVSNQPEVGKKTMTREAVDAALFATVQGVLKQGGAVDYFDFAEEDDDYLKPETGMADRLERFLRNMYNPAYRIDRRRSFVVGARATDRQFAENYLGPSTPWVPHYFESAAFFGWRRRAGTDVLSTMAQARKVEALPDACCDVAHTCAGDGKTPPKQKAPYTPPVYDYPVKD